MVFMDSDLLGILLALLTFILPVVSSVFEKKRKKKRHVQEDMPLEETELHEDVPDRSLELEEMFNAILGLEKENTDEQAAVQMPQQHEVVHEVEHEVEEKFEEAVASTAGVADPQDIPLSCAGPESAGCRNSSFKEKLRNAPADAVILSEILAPKFKEN